MALAPHPHPEDTLLFLAAHATLLQGDPSAVSAAIAQVTDWDRFVHRAFETNLAPLAHACFKTADTAGIPSPVLDALKSYQRKIVVHNTVLYHELENVGLLLNAANIDFIPLKGMMLAEVVYGDISLRQISDIDLLVRVRDVEACKDLLVGAGWECKSMAGLSGISGDLFRESHPYKFIKGKVVIELHQHVHNGMAKYAICIDDYWQRSIKSSFLKGHAHFLCGTDLLQHLCVHFHKHLHSTEIKISTCYDIPLVIRQYGNTIDWGMLKVTSMKYRCWKPVMEVLYLVSNHIDAIVPYRVFDDLESKTRRDTDELFVRRLALPYDQKSPRIKKPHSAPQTRKNRIRVALKTIFPTKQWMVNRYRIQRPLLVYLYYPIRLSKGCARLFSFIGWKLGGIFR